MLIAWVAMASLSLSVFFCSGRLPVGVIFEVPPQPAQQAIIRTAPNNNLNGPVFILLRVFSTGLCLQKAVLLVYGMDGLAGLSPSWWWLFTPNIMPVVTAAPPRIHSAFLLTSDDSPVCWAPWTGC